MDRRTGIHIDPQRSEPLYKQIYEEIVNRIRLGTYPAGLRLPPTRELARELHTHRNTVARAFEELEASGLVRSIVGRGTFIADQPKVQPPGAAQRVQALPWNTLLSHAANARPLSRLDRLMHRIQNEDLINLASLYPSADLLPTDALRRCLDVSLRQHGSGALGFTSRQGLPRLRGAIAGLLQNARMPVSANDVLITTGSQQALDLLARLLVDPGDTVLVDEFTYTGALNAFTTIGADVVSVPSDGYGPDIDALNRLARNGAKVFYVMPNCGNPTGRHMSVERRKQLVDWSHECGIPLIEDDYGTDLDLEEGPSPVALRALDDQVLYIGTFSKRLIPALRIGFVVFPQTLRRQLVALKHSLDLGTSVLMQHALAEFIERGYLRAHLRRMIPQYRARRDALDAALRQHLPDEIRWEKPRRGGFIWLELPDNEDPEMVFEEAHRQGVLISPSTLHTVYRPSRGGLRVAFCAEGPERLVEGARRLGTALRSVSGQTRMEATRGTAPLEGV